MIFFLSIFFNLTYKALTSVIIYVSPRTVKGVHRKHLIASQIHTEFIHMVISTVNVFVSYHHRHHQSLNRESRWGTTDDFATSFLHFPLFSTALWDVANSSPVYSLMLSSHLFLCPPCLLPPFTVPCKMVLARPDERET